MTPSSFIIVTDRGGLKAYRVNETPTRGPSLQLVQAFNITDAHGRFVDKVSDLAGRFPVTNGAGAHHGAGSIAERTQLATEMDRRIHKELADQITKIVSLNGKEDGRSLPRLKFMRQSSSFCLRPCATESSNM